MPSTWTPTWLRRQRRIASSVGQCCCSIRRRTGTPRTRRSANAALFFPRLRLANPLRGNQIEVSSAVGAIAGVFARTDGQRGVWKAPAGLDAGLVNTPQLSVPLTDPENGELNPLGVNCLRAFPVGGRVVWGARTLRGADQLADQYKYIPVRRTALYIEESLYRGLKWAVFEPNDEPLWAQIRLSGGAFMHDLFRKGAFQGSSPKDAYFVKCDSETTTQTDIDLGIVNVVVGFAPLKPAEFVVISIQQIAGQVEV
jgi:phage tail sheath protein FI